MNIKTTPFYAYFFSYFECNIAPNPLFNCLNIYFSTFMVGEGTDYTLTIGGYTGNAGNFIIVSIPCYAED